MRVDHDKAGIRLNEKVCLKLKKQFPHVRINVEYPPKKRLERLFGLSNKSTRKG